jgi:putative ABC transport system permease protein
MPGVIPTLGAAILLLMAASIASLLPAARAARVDVMQALRSE